MRCCPGPAISRLNESDLDNWSITDTIPLSDGPRACNRIRSRVHRRTLLADPVLRIGNEKESVSSLFCEVNLHISSRQAWVCRFFPIWSRTGFKSGVSSMTISIQCQDA